jgi:vacuolar-type H+-ATPase subunit E/Vma4
VGENMTEDIKNLIEKIQEEGVKAAEDKAKQIENEARLYANQIIEKAKKEAEKIISDAKDKVAKMEESGKVSLKQSGRDLLISIRKEIDSMLNKIIKSSIQQSLSPEELSKIIATLIKDYKGKEKENIIVSLKKEDIEKLDKAFLGKLQEEIKKEIVLRPSDDIIGGLIISYDGGKSHFDFTDKTLAEYIGSYIKPKIGEILKEAANS